jgi:hypothetical protein
MKPRIRRMAWALIAAATCAAAPPANAQQRGTPLRIHVRGSAQIDALAWSELDRFTVRGVVTDDAKSPIAWAPLSIQAVSNGGAPPPPLPAADSCAPQATGQARSYLATADGYALETDDSGGFCLRGRAPLAQGSLRVRFPGGKLHDGAEVQLPIEDLQGAVSQTILRFDPAVDVIDLDRESVTVTVALRIDRGSSRRLGGGAALDRDGLAVVIEDERGVKLGEAPTGGDGRVRFELGTPSLGGPGLGELRARFDGSKLLAKVSAGQAVVRRAQVTLALSHPLDPASADDGVPIDIDVGSSRGPVEGGVVEALRAGESVGAAAVIAGRAHVIAAFTSEREGSVPITLRYVPAAPWWRPGPELAVSVPVAGPGVFRQVALAVLVLSLAGWVLGGWRRAPKPAASPADDAQRAPPAGQAGVHVLASGESARGWRGVVKDAHNGSPIARAEIAIVVPAFDGSGVVARAETDESGAFAIEADHRSEARLVVRAPTHSGHEQSLPPPSTLAVALVTRRRALLDRLVRWTRRQGAPFEGPPEPTPGHVRRVASRAQQIEVERWATRIEHAAFGPEPVDERIEQELSTAEPKPGAQGMPT